MCKMYLSCSRRICFLAVGVITPDVGITVAAAFGAAAASTDHTDRHTPRKKNVPERHSKQTIQSHTPEKHSRITSLRNSSDNPACRHTLRQATRLWKRFCALIAAAFAWTSQKNIPETHPRETVQRHIPENLSRDTPRRNSPETHPGETLQRHIPEKLSRDTPQRNSPEIHPFG